MVSSSSLAQKPYHVRSISMPSRPHPLTTKVEEQINKLKASTTKGEAINTVLGSLNEVYHCVEDLLELPLIQQSLVQHQQAKWIEELLDGSLRMLDMCGTLRDVLMQIKEHVQDLQSTLRRARGGESANQSKFLCSMKRLKKELSRRLDSLKRMDNKCMFSPLVDQDQHVSALIKVLKELRAVTVSIFQSIFSSIYESMPKQKASKWSLVSKLMHKGQVACEVEEKGNNDGKTISSGMLQEVEIRIEGIEDGLECTFRRLIQTRVNLLNILTQ